MRRLLSRPGKRGLLLALAAAALLVTPTAASTGARSASVSPQAASSSLPVVVVRSASADKWVSLLRSAGISARVGTFSEALGRGGLVLPAERSLSTTESAELRLYVSRGGHAVVSSPGAAQTLGFVLGPQTSLQEIQMRDIAGTVSWASSYGLWPLGAGSALHGFTALAWNAATVVAASAGRGQGSVLALALDPFQSGLQGHELFPALGTEAAQALAALPGPRRYGAEVYFDPGTLPLPPDQVAARFASARAVYVAGWDYGFLDRSFDYPYAQLIADLHARGVLVYAWLEPPMVNLALWTQHPECREKTENGEDAVVDWRSLIALEDPTCFELAWGAWSSLLHDFDWDGVNVAELYFEYGGPDRFTPFHPSALKAFGHDPAEDPEGFLDWRTREVTSLNQELVERINAFNPGLDVELTVIDDELDPVLGRQVGSDVQALAAVARAANASLQIEDPYTTWSLGPESYVQLVSKVTPLMPPLHTFFDLNVVPRPDIYPTAQMTGVELSLSISAAAKASGRVALYSAATLSDADLAALPFALAGTATTGDGYVSAPWSVVVTSPSSGDRRLELDGQIWPTAFGQAIIPAGRHSLRWLPGNDDRPGLERLSAELLTESARSDELSFSYSAEATAWAIVDRPPTAIALDGARATPETLADPSGGFAIRFPAGDHSVIVTF
jgi:hypothetical protein